MDRKHLGIFLLVIGSIILVVSASHVPVLTGLAMVLSMNFIHIGVRYITNH